MKSIFEQNGGTYTKVGDYYIPNIAVPNTKEYHIGKYGSLRKAFLKEHHPSYYSILILKGKLLEHLAEVDETCHNFLDDMIPKMAKQEGVTEQLKATDQMEWVQRMNSIKHRAEEVVMCEYVYVDFEKI